MALGGGAVYHARGNLVLQDRVQIDGYLALSEFGLRIVDFETQSPVQINRLFTSKEI